MDPRVPALTLLAHPDVSRVGERLILPELNSGETIRLSRVEPHFARPGSSRARALEALHLSRQPFLLVPGTDRTIAVEPAGTTTSIAIDGQRVEDRRLLGADDIARGVVLLLGHRVALLLHLDAAGVDEAPEDGMVGASLEMRRLREEIRIAARIDVPVLLRGESGTGKELLARAIHDASSRRHRAYLAVNMAAFPPALAASELFGASKGAFTGADRTKEGFFTRAHGGTIFLDEVGETPEDVQPLLLRTLENGEIQPLGMATTRSVDVRVIAATDADLESQVLRGAFRSPLLHRLAGYEIRLPPLRARRSDFGRLLVHFLRQELARLGDDADRLDQQTDAERPWPPAGLVARLACCQWPGNVRQLKNVARRMAIAHVTGTELHLEPELLGEPPPDVACEPAARPAELDLRDTLPPGHESIAETRTKTAHAPVPPHGWRPAYRKPSEVSEKELLATLRDHRYELKASAEALGISRGSLYAMVASNPRIRKATELEQAEVEAALARTDGQLDAAADELEVSVHGLRRRVKALGLSLELRDPAR